MSLEESIEKMNFPQDITLEMLAKTLSPEDLGYIILYMSKNNIGKPLEEITNEVTKTIKKHKNGFEIYELFYLNLENRESIRTALYTLNLYKNGDKRRTLGLDDRIINILELCDYIRTQVDAGKHPRDHIIKGREKLFNFMDKNEEKDEIVLELVKNIIEETCDESN